MENKEEYHDPDYPEASVSVKEEPPSVSEDDKISKIKEIIHREFRNELSVRENEVIQIDQRLVYFNSVYYIILCYYNGQTSTTLCRDGKIIAS